MGKLCIFHQETRGSKCRMTWTEHDTDTPWNKIDKHLEARNVGPQQRHAIKRDYIDIQTSEKRRSGKTHLKRRQRGRKTKQRKHYI